MSRQLPPAQTRKRPTPAWHGETAAGTTVDAVVGETAADFVECERGTARSERPRGAPRPSFAAEVTRFLEPVRGRFVDEAIRLDWVTQAALDYAGTPRISRGSSE